MPYTRRASQRVGVRVTAQARQRPHVRWTSKNTRRSPSTMAAPSTPRTSPRTLAAIPTDTWPGMMGNGTPARRPCQMCTSVPHTSEYSVLSRSEPGSSAGSGNSRNSTGTRGAGITAATMGGKGVRIPHASFRIRMPRLRSSLRVPDPREPVAFVPGVQGRRASEAHVGLRGAVEHAGQVVRELGSPDQRVRIVRRPARPRRLQHELNARLRCSVF